MDSDLKCNRLTCRRSLADKAVVTTCSHIFCIECANELFSKSRICPACETNLTEPDDVVVCSLQPTNDYKTSVLSGLTPSTILEICSRGAKRAISFWQYQIHQENAFQQAVVRNVNDKNGQLQKQLDNVIREANGEMNLLNNKKNELERDLELERRKVRELQETARERDKEYQRLKSQLDKIKRKTLFGPTNENSHGQALFHPNQFLDKARSHAVDNNSNNVDLTAVVDGMEANGIQRTPLVARTTGATFMSNTNHPQQGNTEWTQSSLRPAPTHSRDLSHRPPFVNYTNSTADRSNKSGTTSRSTSANEVERLLKNQQQLSRTAVPNGGGWRTTAVQAPIQRNIFAPQSNNIRSSGGFRPSIPK